jgi:hypothetical protein
VNCGSVAERPQSRKLDPLAESTRRTCTHVAQRPAFGSMPSSVGFCGFSLLHSRAIELATNFDRPRPIAYGFDGAAGAADPLSGAAGFVKSASAKFTFKSILSITSFCVRSVAELPESISNANFNPPTSR